MNELAPFRPDRRAAERGSTYLFVLLVLFVLTVLGLSLSIVTQTELQIGGAQKSATRVLYGADAGTDIQLAHMLLQDYEQPSRRFDLGLGTAADNIDVSPFLYTHRAACNLCKVNKGEQQYQVINFVVNGEGRRLNTSGALTHANKLVSTMMMVQPLKLERVDQGRAEFDPDVAADVVSTPGLDVVRY